MRKRPLYYPVKTENGFVIERTLTAQKNLDFAAFETKKTAVSMGKIWYGKEQRKKKVRRL